MCRITGHYPAAAPGRPGPLGIWRWLVCDVGSEVRRGVHGNCANTQFCPPVGHRSHDSALITARTGWRFKVSLVPRSLGFCRAPQALQGKR